MPTILFDIAQELPVYKIIDGYAHQIEDNLGILFVEGEKTEITFDRYERDNHARKKCLEHFGYRCQICGFDFQQTYGELAKGFIHVHHKTWLSDIGKGHNVDPIVDLIPVCPNCHAMFHYIKQGAPLTPENLRDIVKKHRYSK